MKTQQVQRQEVEIPRVISLSREKIYEDAQEQGTQSSLRRSPTSIEAAGQCDLWLYFC